MIKTNRIRDITSGARALMGIISSKYVFSGPRSIALSISDVCNTNCVMCWYHSPVVRALENGQHKRASTGRQAFMEPDLFETIIRESFRMGTYRVVLGGKGDPSLHPQFDRMLEIMDEVNMVPYVLTNGLALDEQRAKNWSTKRAHFRFSVHAGDLDTWLRVHPASTAKEFERLSNIIKSLAQNGLAKISILHVIHKANYRHVCEMVEHARATGVREILFRPVRAEGPLADIILNKKEEHWLHKELVRCHQLAEGYGINTNLSDYLEDNLYIRSGRLQTQEIYQKIPCYVGWIYAEFDIDGTMTPCIHSKRVMGQVGRDQISDMWHSSKYRQFRSECRSMPRRGELVRGCECHGCCMTKYNLNIHKLLHLRSLNYGSA